MKQPNEARLTQFDTDWTGHAQGDDSPDPRGNVLTTLGALDNNKHMEGRTWHTYLAIMSWEDPITITVHQNGHQDDTT